MLVLSKLSVRMLGDILWLSSLCVMEEQLATGLGLNQLRLEPLGGDFESVTAHFPPGARTGGFGSTNGFPPTTSVFPPGYFVESANSLPHVDFHVENSLSEFELENVFSTGNLTRRMLTKRMTYQLSREESDL